jgi:hypothetical protein
MITRALARAARRHQVRQINFTHRADDVMPGGMRQGDRTTQIETPSKTPAFSASRTEAYFCGLWNLTRIFR